MAGSSHISHSDQDAVDDSRLADALDDSPERIHSEPLPSRPSFPGRNKAKDAPQASEWIESKDHRLSADSANKANYDASNRTSMSHWDPEPGFAHIDGEVGGSGYNETTVDIVTVPCPGADPVETWTRDPLPEGYFGNPADNDLTSQPAIKQLAGDAILSPGIGGRFSKAAHLWVRQGIRRYASNARVMLYRHRELTDSATIDSLARDLLESVLERRGDRQQHRPLFFVAHSVGGLVVKRVLVIASKDEQYRGILYNCHGVSFFATPHRGSSYLSMTSLSGSIQTLLHLQRPLPRDLSNELRVRSKGLDKLHEEFTDIASELRIWSFYETIDSLLSGSGFGDASEVKFSAPLVSIKSAIVGVRQEVIYSSLQSDHAHCASFGITNPRTLATYLQDLSNAISKATSLSETRHTPLRLDEHVKVEITGFYEDPSAIADPTEPAMRLYITKYHLKDFLHKGPEVCLEERLKRVPRFAGSTGHGASTMHQPARGGGKLSILGNVQELWKSALSRSYHGGRSSSPKPDIVIDPPVGHPDPGDDPGAARPGRRIHSLTLPTLVTPGFHRPSSRSSNATTSTMSDPTGLGILPREHSPAGRGQHSEQDPTRPKSGSSSKDQGEETSGRPGIMDFTAGFSRPETDQRKFMWIHLPFTNPLWVRDIFGKLSETHGSNTSRLFNNENWVSRHVQGRHSQSQPSFIKPAVGFIPGNSPPSPRAISSPGGIGKSPSYLYLYLPYLHFDTYKHIVKRRRIITRRLAQGRARPVSKDIADLDSLELRVIWQYISSDPPLNFRRTLDQFGYPSLKDTYARDDDQMLYKLTKEDERFDLPRSPSIADASVLDLSDQYSVGTKLLHELVKKENEITATSDIENQVDSNLRDGNLLMVDQLWMWAIDSTTLTTFFPKRESRPSEGALFQQADLRNSIYNELNGDLTGRCENALDLAAFVVLHAVTVLLDRSSHPDLDIFRIFEEAIGLLTERMTSNLKSFRMQTFKDVDDDSDDLPEDNTAASIKKRHKREIARAERENRENTSAMLELRDMEDELRTLNKLFETQHEMISRMAEIYSSESMRDSTHYGQGYLQEALSKLVEYKTQTTEMIDRVGATRGDYEKMLEMAQRQAQVDDVRWSRLQTELASSQNLSVMIFTIFTVIFLPLSFFTSVFGMNTLEWSDQYPSLSYIGEISLPVSAFMILATLIAAFNSRVQTASQLVYRRSKKSVQAVLASARRLQPEAARRAKERMRADREREASGWREERRREREYDFWATVKKQRTNLGMYEIPGSNKNRMADGNVGRSSTGFDSAESGAASKYRRFRSATRAWRTT